MWDKCGYEITNSAGETDTVLTLACIPTLFVQLLTMAVTFAGIIALFYVIWGGYKLLTSGGDAKEVEGARHVITYAIIGMVLVFLSYFILQVIGQITGVTCISMFGLNQCQ